MNAAPWLFTGSLSSLDGVSRSGRELVQAMRANSSNVTVFTHALRYPSMIPVSERKYIEHVPVPENTYLKRLSGSSMKRRAWLIMQHACDIRRRQLLSRFSSKRDRQRRGIFIVNNVRYHKTAQPIGHIRKNINVLICQESIRHFDNHIRGVALDDVVQMISKYDAIIFASERCRQEWCEFEPIQAKKTFYLPNTSDEDASINILRTSQRELRQKLGLPLDRFVAVCLASIQFRKGQDLLLEQLDELTRRIPNLLLLFVGMPIGDWGDDFIEKASHPKSKHTAKVLGPIESAIEYVRAADALVLPSRAEAMPLTILEAMSVSTPVVASDVDGIPELVEHNKSGWLFPLGERESLVEGLATIANAPEVGKRWAEAALQRYKNEFSRAKYAERLGGILAELEPNGSVGS